ncbi:MAG: ATPase, T2SS/T4P/T4SS family [Alphaproteobacteria bacterium]
MLGQIFSGSKANGAAHGGGADHAHLEALRRDLKPLVFDHIKPSFARRLGRKELAGRITDVIMPVLDRDPEPLDLIALRELINMIAQDLLGATTDSLSEAESAQASIDAISQAAPAPGPRPKVNPHLEAITVEAPRAKQKPAPSGSGSARPISTPQATIASAMRQIKPILMERIDIETASALEPDILVRELDSVVAEIRDEIRLHLNANEHRDLVRAMVDDMVGLGPLEPLLADESVSDIMVNGPHQVYIERGGKLVLTDVKFVDNAHVMNVATRIVTRIGRRVDESNPICDARLLDGSRVNVIAPPLAIDGCSISIRKFSQKKLSLDSIGAGGGMSPGMVTTLKIASRSRLNIIVSGGTGSGKTTLLNALSELIDHGERIVTIEDAAELQLQQPHVIRLETRPASLEGTGEITMRDLVKNSLRMRPDRIILGEVRGPEAIDMLQAMNTGHDGSMCTLHANSPRDALTRMENMINMGTSNLPSKAIRHQIAGAVDLIVQASRMRDGRRRITNITEVIGMEGDVIVTQELFKFEFDGENDRGELKGNFKSAGMRPHFLPKADYYGLGQALLEVL